MLFIFEAKVALVVSCRKNKLILRFEMMSVLLLQLNLKFRFEKIFSQILWIILLGTFKNTFFYNGLIKRS